MRIVPTVVEPLIVIVGLAPSPLIRWAIELVATGAIPVVQLLAFVQNPSPDPFVQLDGVGGFAAKRNPTWEKIRSKASLCCIIFYTDTRKFFRSQLDSDKKG